MTVESLQRFRFILRPKTLMTYFRITFTPGSGDVFGDSSSVRLSSRLPVINGIVYSHLEAHVHILLENLSSFKIIDRAHYMKELQLNC